MNVLIKFSIFAVLLTIQSQFFVEGNFFSQSGDIIVSGENGKIKCDQIICPPGSVKCIATKESNPNNLKEVIRTNKCFDQKGKELSNVVKKENSPTPGSKVSLKVEGGGDASGSGSASGSGFWNGFNFPTVQPGFFPMPQFNTFGNWPHP